MGFCCPSQAGSSCYAGLHDRPALRGSLTVCADGDLYREACSSVLSCFLQDTVNSDFFYNFNASMLLCTLNLVRMWVK